MATDLAYWEASPLAYVLVLVGGLILGSFLNVVITRLPMMAERDERRMSLLQLDIEPSAAKPLNLAWPRSFCLHCRTTIKAQFNIPIVSWLWLRGRCATCEQAISVRFPLVESLTTLLLFVLYSQYGLTLEFVFKSFFCLTLLAVAYMDWETGWLPDAATIPLIGAGLLYSTFTLFQINGLSPTDSIIGAVAGYGFFWFLNFVFRSFTNRDGIGFGDFKLVAALGAWLGWVMLPLVLLVAASLACLFGLALMIAKKYDAETGIRFAPFLSLVGIALLFARDLNLLPLYLIG